jgi:hypothetical protein
LGATGDSRAGEDVEAEVAAAFSPFVLLFGQDGADEACQGITTRQARAREQLDRSSKPSGGQASGGDRHAMRTESSRRERLGSE